VTLLASTHTVSKPAHSFTIRSLLRKLSIAAPLYNLTSLCTQPVALLSWPKTQKNHRIPEEAPLVARHLNNYVEDFEELVELREKTLVVRERLLKKYKGIRFFDAEEEERGLCYCRCRVQKGGTPCAICSCLNIVQRYRRGG